MELTDVLVVGSGGREHALAWKMRQSRYCRNIYAAPGNPGLAELGQCLSIAVDDHEGLVLAAKSLNIGLVVIGPERPLAEGLADKFRAAGILCFGPSAEAARLEADKGHARNFMRRHRIPAPRFTACQTMAEVEQVLSDMGACDIEAGVVKASGLAEGKGVVVCNTLDEVRLAASQMLVDGRFGEAGRRVLIEERLEGEEASLFAISDGRRYHLLPPAQDYKPALDGDRGPNTGGMGAYAPAPILWNEHDLTIVDNSIVAPTIDGMAEEGCPFQGCLYFGLMKTKEGEWKVIEYNCRFGDPETQAIVPILREDLLCLLTQAAEGGVWEEFSHSLDPEQKAVTVVLVNDGYPGSYKSGGLISGLDEVARLPDVQLFQAGTTIQDGLRATGGRVLAVTGVGKSFRAARSNAYQAAGEIDWEGCDYRSDIGDRVIRRKR